MQHPLLTEVCPDPSKKRYTHWAVNEIRFLKYNWGELDLAKLARLLGRTEIAVSSQAKKLKLGSPNSGTLRLEEILRESGYSRSRIEGAIKVLRIQPARCLRIEAGRGKQFKNFAFTEEQASRIYAFLATIPDGKRLSPTRGKVGAWGEKDKPLRCTKCERTDRPHVAKGYCGYCYDRFVKGVWNTTNRPNGCAWCGTTEIPYKSNNLCNTCHNRYFRESYHEKKRGIDPTAGCASSNGPSPCHLLGSSERLEQSTGTKQTKTKAEPFCDSKPRQGKGSVARVPRASSQTCTEYSSEVHLQGIP